MCIAGAREARLWPFAAVFALHVALGDDPEKITFDQAKMRSHFLECLNRKSDFHMKEDSQTVHFPMRTVLSCLVPETYGDMVQCDDM